jgi:hypothetical protein
MRKLRGIFLIRFMRKLFALDPLKSVAPDSRLSSDESKILEFGVSQDGVSAFIAIVVLICQPFSRCFLRNLDFHQITVRFHFVMAGTCCVPLVDNLKRKYNITALQRGLHLLQLFSELPHGLIAKQVSARSRLPESTVHRFLSNLEGAGFLNRCGDGVYHLGIAGFAMW